MLSAQDDLWMAGALHLAERGLQTTSPNPRVGCLLVRNNKIVGEGWHQYAGQAHAEIYALRSAGEAAHGATAYITLEPCSHQGSTPPCVDALITANVARVVAAAQDPNPRVAGKGIQRLRTAGIEVECGLMEAAARELNIGFFSRMTHGLPWLRSKIAMSLDGRTALHNGVSQWITGVEARQDVQYWRGRSCAILTGIDTILADNPRLTVREPQLTKCGPTFDTKKTGVARQPLRVILDSQLKLPLTANILRNGNVVIYTAVQDTVKTEALEKLGARVIILPDAAGQVDLTKMLRSLADIGCNEVLTEAGSTLNGALLQAGLVNELILYVSPQLLGDLARGVAKLGELIMLSQNIKLQWQDVRNIGADLRIVARVVRSQEDGCLRPTYP